MKSIATNIIPAVNPSITSFESIFLIYNIPKKVVAIIVAAGAIILTFAKKLLKKGFITSVKKKVMPHIKIP